MFAFLDPRTGRVRRFLLPVLFLLMLAFGSATTVKSAQATVCVCPEITAVNSAGWAANIAKWIQEHADWIQAFELLNTIISIVTGILKLFEEVRDMLAEKLSVLIATEHIDNALKYMAEKTMHQDAKGTIIDSTINGVKADVVARNFRRPDVKADCYTYLARQGLSGNQFFNQSVSNALLQMIETQGIGRGQDEDGPLGAWKRYIYMCGPGSNFPKGMFAEMEPPAGCKEEKYSGLLTSSRLVSGAYVLEIPDFKTETFAGVPKSVPVPSNDEQKNFVAAAVWLTNMVGFRPSPPVGDAIKTHAGMVEVAQWHHCAAVQSALAKPCTDLIAKFTRPDCSKSQYKLECDASKRACDAVSKSSLPNGGSPAIDVSKMPGFDCAKGLSTYQVEYLNHLLCLTSDRAIALPAQGASVDANTAAVDVCAVAWSQWQTKLATEQDACTQAAAKMASLSCWPKPNRTPAVGG